MSGTLFAQMVTFAFIPIITRLYTPAEFGLFSLFYSIANIIGLISSWKYDQAIMLPKSDRDAQALVFLSICITFAMTLFVTLGIAIFYNFLVDYFSGNVMLIWLIPIGVLLVGLLQIFNAYSSRRQYYKQIATVKAVNAVSVASIQTLSKYLFKLDGLVIGKLAADFLTLLQYLRIHIKRESLQLRSISRRRMTVNALRHSNFPKFQSFTVFLNSLSQNLPVLLFASLYSPEVAGYYALTVRVLQVPVGLIGASTKEVYYQRASRMHANNENILELYKKTTLNLFRIFLIPMITLLMLGEYIFSWVFGSAWNVSGQIAQILIVWFLFLFINSPSMMTFSILKLQKVQMKLELFSIVMRFASIYLGYLFFDSYMMAIVLFMLSSVMVNVYAIHFIYSKLSHFKPTGVPV
jgi:O-antigen/teichoic acid export membrane protein